jgi:putative ABC transport system permease protein
MAYPILSKMMSMLTTTGANIFLICIGIVFIIFSIVYISIYSITARTYYRIVS